MNEVTGVILKFTGSIQETKSGNYFRKCIVNAYGKQVKHTLLSRHRSDIQQYKTGDEVIL